MRMLAATVAAALGLAGCARRDAAPVGAGVFRFIDHLEEARVEGIFPEAAAREVEVYADGLEIAAKAAARTPRGASAGSPASLVPFAGFEPPAEAGATRRTAWRAARDAAARAVAPGPDERVAGSRGLRIGRLTSADFTGVRTAAFPIHPGGTYRIDVWIRTDGLMLPSPEAGAMVAAFGLALGGATDADARLDEQSYFANRAVPLHEIAPGSVATGTTDWRRESLVVRADERADHMLVCLLAHGPQAGGPRSGAVRFDDLRVVEILAPLTALPPIADHFAGGAHALKKKARLVEGADERVESTWNAILAPVPGRIAYEVRVPAAARLAFAYAPPPPAWNDGGGVTFAVDVERSGRAERVFEAAVRPGAEPAGHGWRVARVDLAAFAGESVTLRFVTEREDANGVAAAFWGEPVLYRARSTEARDAAPRSVLLVSIDTLRPDRLGCYGSPRRVSPMIDRLASGGAIFERCVSSSSWTLPAHASMLTGVSSSAHGVTSDGRRLAPARVTLAELLRRDGFATGAIVTHYYLTGDYGLDRGFESFAYRQDLPAADACARAAEWLSANADRPSFLFLHLFDPHWDYRAPEPFVGVAGGSAARAYDGPVDGTLERLQPWIEPRAAVAAADLARALDLYDAEIAAVDAALGRLFAALDSLGLSERTLVVLTSDHGEEFRDHGSFGHGHTLYDEVVRVPLVVRAPDRAGRGGGGARGDVAGAERTPVRGDVAATIDIAPTILAWAGAASDAAWEPEGRDLLATAAHAPSASATAESRSIVSETERFGTWRMALTEWPLKYHTPGQYLWWRPFARNAELFDLAADPGETRNLLHAGAAGGPDAAARSADLAAAAARRYVALHRGLVLVACGAAGASHALDVRLAGASLGAPTGVGLERGDAAALHGDDVAVAIDLPAGDRDVILVRPEGPGNAVQVTVAWDGKAPPAGVVLVGPGRRPAMPPLTIDLGSTELALDAPVDALAWEGPGLWILASPDEAGTHFALDEEDLQRLRALGYVR
jgi:arylsulfatase A-like enzyme